MAQQAIELQRSVGVTPELDFSEALVIRVMNMVRGGPCIQPVNILGQEESHMLGYHAVHDVFVDQVRTPRQGEDEVPSLRRGVGFATGFWLLRAATGNDTLPQLPSSVPALKYARTAASKPAILERDFEDMYTETDQPHVRRLFADTSNGFTSPESRWGARLVLALHGHLVKGNTSDDIYTRTYASELRSRFTQRSPRAHHNGMPPTY